MARDDWYRNKTWDEAIEAEFEQRLGRARDKAQYLKLQAGGLAKSHPQVSLALIERFFALGDNFDLASGYLIRAEAMAALGNLDGAFSSYEDVLAREAAKPSVLTNAYVDYPLLTIEVDADRIYGRALKILDGGSQRPKFPVDRYRFHGARALLLEHFGRHDEARDAAVAAMVASEEKKSGFQKHQDLGLVSDTTGRFGERVRAIAAAHSTGTTFRTQMADFVGRLFGASGERN